ncbi:MAG: hypothetical protein O2V44_04510 [Candidatus Bathyarchaeota archaeon]|nr:hypothetical protein [Candidatus Bathyarchaeota archaeon]
MDKINLRELERKAYLSYHQDGILDIFIGFSILLFGLWILADMAYLAGAFAAIFAPIYAQVKKQITVPRLGYVKFASSRTAKTKKTMLLLVITGVLTLIPAVLLFITTESGILTPIQMLIEYGTIVIGVAGMILLAAVAYTSEIRRLYAYSALFFAIFTGGYFLSIPFFYYLMTLGVVIMLSGAYLLIRFLHEYPLPVGETSDGGQ